MSKTPTTEQTQRELPSTETGETIGQRSVRHLDREQLLIPYSRERTYAETMKRVAQIIDAISGSEVHAKQAPTDSAVQSKGTTMAEKIRSSVSASPQTSEAAIQIAKEEANKRHDYAPDAKLNSITQRTYFSILSAFERVDAAARVEPTKAKDLADATTPIARELLRNETGRDFDEMGRSLSKEWKRSQGDRYAAANPPLWEIASKYIRVAYFTGRADCDYDNGRALDCLEDSPVSSASTESTDAVRKEKSSDASCAPKTQEDTKDLG